MVAPILVVLGAAVVIGHTWLVIASFLVLLVTLRAQRRQEIKRLHGYRRKKRRPKSRGSDGASRGSDDTPRRPDAEPRSAD